MGFAEQVNPLACQLIHGDDISNGEGRASIATGKGLILGMVKAFLGSVGHMECPFGGYLGGKLALE
jgi:hypothetical protein